MQFRKGWVLAKVDDENGCEQCWDELLAELERHGVKEVGYRDRILVPRRWRGKRCPHGAPKYAPSILL